MNKLNITVGSDPELVIVDNALNPRSAIKVLRNDKQNPMDLGDGVLFYADNALAELAFPPVAPEHGPSAVLAAIRKAISRLAPAGYNLMAKAATTFSLRELRHRDAWAIGCSTNFDAYRWAPNPKGTFTSGLRTGSFHIHVGNAEWKAGKDKRLLANESKANAIKLLDLYLGLSSIVFDKDETSPFRRSLYGRAGEFRPTPYGVEYRVLGNYALRSERLIKLVFDLVSIAMSHIEAGTESKALAQLPQNDIVSIINNNLVEDAKKAVMTLDLPWSVAEEIFSNEQPKSAIVSP